MALKKANFLVISLACKTIGCNCTFADILDDLVWSPFELIEFPTFSDLRFKVLLQM